MKYVYSHSKSFDKEEAEALQSRKFAQQMTKSDVAKVIINEWSNLEGNGQKLMNWKQKLEANAMTEQDFAELKKELQFILPIIKDAYTILNQSVYKI